MKLTKNQFLILEYLEANGGKATQRVLATALDLSLGSINKAMGELRHLQYIEEDGRLTEEGILALEPYRAKRAIFLAAGFGERLIPITLNTPKPLVRVNGKRIIDTLLDAVTAIGIEEIYIVRGYLAEQFDQLLYRYPNIQFLENPMYGESNNISSMMVARYLLKNAYVFEADIFLRNPSLIKKYHYNSNYVALPVDVTDDWCFTMEGEHIATMMQGGAECYREYGISYWSKEDGATLPEHIRTVYETIPGGKERFWDTVPIEYYHDNYRITIRECQEEDLVEIDTFRELKEMDSSYDVK